MSKSLKPKRGTTEENDAYIGEAYEVTLDTEKHTLRVHDGVTPGGHELAKAADMLTEAQVQAARDAAQDEAIAGAQSSAGAAQTTANQALDAAQNITVPVTSVNGQTGAVTVGTVRSVNGTAADAAGNVTVTHPVTSVNGMTGAVTISTTPSTVKGVIGSAVAANGSSLTLPSGGTWFVFNTYGHSQTDAYTGNEKVQYGVTSNSSNKSISYGGGTFSGGTTVYAAGYKTYAESYVRDGKLVAVRIS